MHQPDYGEARDSARGHGSTMRMRCHAPHLPPNQEILLSRLTPADACTGESAEMASSESVESVGEGVPNSEEEEQRSEVASRLMELRLVLLGWRWPGKSLTGNTILGREEFRLERAAEFCVKRETVLEGRKVTVVDTPGWFSSQTTPESYQQEMMQAPSLCAPGPHAFLLVIPVGMFTETDRLRVEENMALFGERIWRHTILVFTWAPGLRDMPIERHIHREGRDLQWVVEGCRNRYHVINNQVFGEHPQLALLIEKIENMVAEEGGFYVDEEKPATVSVDGRDLGARPKQNGSAVMIQNAEPSQSVCNDGESGVATTQ
uniref:GTPase IMAP family member 4-like n=2 Tax=Paramormyrops kingsleyae TaxID=1676925 RepID=A0A3B3S8T3_9TELE|nr:GTPase IMAP family member 4-like [Paramormyrops kingsleyae]